MKEYHPPMTGLEAHFEDEIDPKGRRKSEQELKDAEKRPKASRENADDKRAEEAMHLGQ